MRSGKNVLCFAAAGTIVLTACMPCTAAAENKIEISLMHFWSEEEAARDGAIESWRTMLKEWEEEHPEVWINENFMNQTDYTNKIQAFAAVGDLPDIMLVKGSWMENFVNSDLLLEMDDYIEAYEYKDSFYEDAFLGSTKNDHIYGMPNQASLTSFVFYNEALWQEAGYEIFPDNWNDIFKASEYFAEKGIATFALGNVDLWEIESCWLSAIGDRYTGTKWTNSIIAADGNAKFTDAEFVKALEHIESLVPLFNDDFGTISDAKAVEYYYCQGRAAAVVDGQWTLGKISTNSTQEVLEHTQIALLPAVDGGLGNANTTSGGYGWFFAVNSELAGTEKGELCMELLLKTCGYEMSEYYMENYGLLGACRVEDPNLAGVDRMSAKFAAAVSEIDNFTPVYDLLMDASVIEVMNTGIQKMLNGEKSAAELAQEIQDIQEVYQENQVN